MRIGVFGGTFDPPHIGHIATALEVRHQLQLDRMLMVVANDPWQKSARRGVTGADLRFRLVELAVKDLKAIIVSDIEIHHGGQSHTADTLAELRAEDPSGELFHLVGSDAAAGLDTWKRPDEVMALATTVVVDRGGRQGGRPPSGWPHIVLEVPAIEVSSSDIRARFADGRPVEALVVPAVVCEVRRLGLYGSNR